MDLLKLAQLLNNRTMSKEKKSKLLKEVDVKYMLPDTGQDKEQISRWAGCISLHVVALLDDVDLINELLARGADIVKQGIADGQTPLHLVVDSSVYDMHGQLQKENLINTLLSKQVEIKNTGNPKCEDGISHLHIACIVNHAEAVEFFAEAKVPLGQSISNNFDLRGYTPLHCAIQYSSVEAADILLRHGVDITVRNADGVSSLQQLIERTVAMNDFIRMGKPTLSMSYEEEKKRLESIVTLVLKTRAKDDILLDDTGLTALHVACTVRDKSFVENLMKEGIDINVAVKSESKFWPGWTPVHFAACFDIDMIMLLMQTGANILVKNSRGETALDLCAMRFTPADIQLVLSVDNEFKEIVLSDDFTKLSALLKAMSNLEKFSAFLEKLKNVNVRIPLDSPIWPGYNLLHLSVSLNEKTSLWKDFEEIFQLSEAKNAVKPQNCTEDENNYMRRIELCLKYGCSVSMKNVSGQTPIHLAFSTSRKAAAQQLLSHSEDNDVDHNNLSHLHIACALGHLDAVKKYLGKDADVDGRVKIGFDWLVKPYKESFDVENRKTLRSNLTPLHFAVACGHRDIVKCLLQNNADVYAKDSLDFTPIHLLMLKCCRLFETRSLAKLLFEAAPNLQDCVGAANLSHLHVAACEDRNDKAVMKLLRNGAEVNRVIESDVEQFPFLGSRAGSTALHLAREGAVKSLLKAGADVHAKDSEGVSALQHSLRDMSSTPIADFVWMLKKGRCDVGSCGITLLHVACGRGDIEWVNKLIRQGADVNARITDVGYTMPGATPLHVAFEEASMLGSEGLVDIVELLLDNGADASLESCGSTPLHLIYERFYCTTDDEALRAGDLLLNSHKSYHVNPLSPHGFSYLHFACMRNNVDAVTKFLDHGVDVDALIDPFADVHAGFTPLHFAMAHRSREVAYLLLERGADVNAEDVYGDKPLHTAIKKKFVDLPLIETILGLGADIHAENLDGETLLYRLLKYGNITRQNLEFFLNRGCSVDMLDNTNKFRQEVIGLIMLKAPPSEIQPILERLLQTDELRSAIQNGLNVIQSIVSNDGNDELTVDDYLNAIKLLINNGCDLDQQDSKGTPLHEAARFCNLQAMDALLQLDADVNVVDDKKSPLNEIIEAANNSDERKMNVTRALACHIWKMRLTGLEVSQSNLTFLEEIEERNPSIGSFQRFCQAELAKAQETEICKGLTVRDFLSELGAVAEYPRMCPMKRFFVDKFFKKTVDLRREFPNFCGLLAFQYKKALCRMELSQPAMQIILSICQVELPYLCLEAILRYFTNNEVKAIIEFAKELI